MKLCAKCLPKNLFCTFLKMPVICDMCGSPLGGFLVEEKILHKYLMEKLEPYSMGCFSGKVSEWPQLKTLLKEIYDYLKLISD